MPAANLWSLAKTWYEGRLAPDWKPITWTEDERRNGQARGLKTIETFDTHGTPPLPDQHGGGTDAGQDDLSEKGIAS